MNKTDAFVYSMDEELVRSVHPDWPQDIGLLLCMKADGTCCTVLFHQEEGNRALRKAAAALDMPTRSFAVAPEVRGWPTRMVRFSEEQDMLTIVAEVPGLAERAGDYADSFEAGKDDRGALKRQAAEEAATKPATATPARRLNLSLSRSDVAEKVLRKSAEQAPGMPVGFGPGDTHRECYFGSGHIGVDDGHVRVILAPDKVTIHTQPVLVREIGFSADFWRFYLPRNALKGWVPGKAAVVDIPQDAFPEALRRAFGQRLFHFDATITSEGVFLAPGGPVSLPKPPPPEVVAEVQPAKPRRRWFTPVRTAAAVCALAGTAAAAVNMVPLDSGRSGGQSFISSFK